MNWYFCLAGGIGVVGALAHTVLGDRWTIAPLDEENLATPKFSGIQNKRFIRWFWHVGSVVLMSSAIISLLTGLGQIDFSRPLMSYLAFIWVGSALVFTLLATRPPSQFSKMPPGIVSIIIATLLILGLLE